LPRLPVDGGGNGDGDGGTTTRTRVLRDRTVADDTPRGPPHTAVATPQ